MKMSEIWMQKISNLTEYVAKVFALIVLLFEEVKLILLGVTMLIVIDQFTGVWRALKSKNKENKFSWNKFKNGYAKIILYLTCIIASFFYEEFIIGTHSHYFTKGIGAVIGFQELASIYLNVSVITGTDFLQKYIDKLRSKL